MHATPELVRLTIAERERDAAASRLAALARLAANCCRRASLLARLSAAIRRADAAACCPSNAERLAMSIRTMNGI